MESQYSTSKSTRTSVWHDTSPRNIRVVFGLPPVTGAKKNMGNDKKKPAWEKNSRGFWLAVCLILSALAGWLMFHLNILH